MRHTYRSPKWDTGGETSQEVLVRVRMGAPNPCSLPHRRDALTDGLQSREGSRVWRTTGGARWW